MAPDLTTAARAQQALALHGLRWWRSGDMQALDAACAGVPDAALGAWPDVARWRALAALMHEQADALSCLELAHAGHLARGDACAAGHDANIALALCLVDLGAMGSVADWLQRARAAPMAAGPQDEAVAVWQRLGVVARAVLGDDSAPELAAATAWLHAQLQPLQSLLGPDERLIVAQVLLNLHLAQRQFEKFDAVAAAVGVPALFGQASPVMRCRWLHTLGFAHYQIGNEERAEAAWQRALDVARDHGLAQARLMASLALMRLSLDRGQLADAERIESAIQPEWGAGRETQLIELKQMSARLQLMREQPVRALATLQEALALADQTGLTAPERASCLTDLAQALIANARPGEAVELLAALARDHGGRDGEVFRCLLELLQAWRGEADGEGASRELLAAGLRRAQQVRYTMFFRLLPWLAAQVCALALRWQVEPIFAAEVVRARALQAPADADERWPWLLYLRMLGTSEIRLRGKLEAHKGKVQKKPLELLRALACADGMSLAATAAADALWPEADGDAARKSLEMSVQRLRRLLADDEHLIVRVGDGRVWLDPGRVSSDVAQRRALIRRLEAQAAAPGPVAACVALVLRIAAIGSGPLLPGAPDAPWLQWERQRCERDEARAARAAAAALARADATPSEKALLESGLRATHSA